MIAYPRYTTVKSFLEEVPKSDYSFLGFTLLIFLVYAVLGLRPGLTEIARTFTEVRSAKKAEALLNQKIERLSEYYKYQDLLAENGPLLERALPKSPAQAQIILDLAVFAGRSGFNIRAFSFQEAGQTESESELKGASISLSGEGSYAQILNFAKELEESNRQYRIETMSFSFSKESALHALFLGFNALYVESP